MTTAQQIELRLAGLKPISLEILDESGKHVGHEGARDGGGHYQLTIVSSAFTGASRISRHRMVYDALGDLMQREVHALAIEAFAPDEL